MTCSLAALGVSKSVWDPLGRWAASGSDDYVRSYRALVRRLVGVFVMGARSGMAYRDLDEESAMDDLSIHLLQKGVGKEDVDEKIVAMRRTAAGILGDLAGVKAAVIYLPRAPKETDASTELAKGGEDDEDDTKGEKTLDYISHPRNKRNMTMLGCWRARGLKFLDYHVFEGGAARDRLPVSLRRLLAEVQAQKEHRSRGAGFSVDIFKRVVCIIGGVPFVWDRAVCVPAWKTAT